jgi:predicted dehydrogenase
MPDKPFRIGIIGAGNSGRMQADSIRKQTKANGGAPLIEIGAICDTNEKSLNALGDDFQLPQGIRYTDLAKMLAEIKGKLDYIVVATPSGIHAKIGIQVAQSGHNVVVEKPIEITLGKADALIEACQKARVHLYVISQNRLKPDVQLARQIIQSGGIGDIVSAYADTLWFREPDYYLKGGGWRGTWAMDGGGALMNQGIHALDALLFLAGPLASVQAYGRTAMHSIEAEDFVMAQGRLKNGAFAQIAATTCYHQFKLDEEKPNDTNTLRIHGTKGVLVLDKYVMNPISTRDGPEYKRVLSVDSGQNVASGSGPLAQSGHAEQLLAIGRAIRTHNKANMVTGEDARETLRAIMAIYRSIQYGSQPEFLVDSDKTYVPDPAAMKAALRANK